MQSFIVLGIIPGTNIQTNLNFWIVVATLLAVFALRTRLRIARDVVRMHLALHKMARVIERCEFSPAI